MLTADPPREVTGIIRVLVIDEGVDEVRCVRDTLQRAGEFHVHGTRSLSEASDLLETGAFDIALIDESAWDIEGHDLVEAARAFPGLTILLLATATHSLSRRPAGALGTIDRSRVGDGSYLRRELRAACTEHRALRRRDTMTRWLEREACTDRMTGLHNRHAFEDRLATACRMASERHEPTAVIVADVTGTRTVNQAHGREAGDSMIRRAAAGIARCVRASDFAARIGGDEFGIVVAGGDLDVARRIARRIAHQLDQMNDNEWQGDIPVSLTFGVACGITDDADALLRAAQQQARQQDLVRPAPFFARAWRDEDGPSVA